MDTINRQDAIDAVAEGLKGTFVEYRDVAEKMLNKVPSAQTPGAQMAYYMGLHDGVKECNEKLEKFIDEMRRQE